MTMVDDATLSGSAGFTAAQRPASASGAPNSDDVAQSRTHMAHDDAAAQAAGYPGVMSDFPDSRRARSATTRSPARAATAAHPGPLWSSLEASSASATVIPGRRRSATLTRTASRGSVRRRAARKSTLRSTTVLPAHRQSLGPWWVLQGVRFHKPFADAVQAAAAMSRARFARFRRTSRWAAGTTRFSPGASRGKRAGDHTSSHKHAPEPRRRGAAPCRHR